MEYIIESNKTVIRGEYDVVVIGGGVAGVAAALAAARDKAKVLLVEKMTVLGGLATAGHVIVYLPLCDGYGRKVIGGIPEELLYTSIKYGYDNLPDEWRGGPEEAATGRRYQTVFNAPAFVMALDEIIRAEKIDVLLDTVFCDVKMDGDMCTAIIVENKSGRQAYKCKAAVDASGDCDALYRAGAPCVEQDNHLTYWAYYLHDMNDKYAGIDGPSPYGVKAMVIGNFRGSDLPPGLPKYKGTDARQVTEFLLKGREMALERIKSNRNLTFTSFPSQAQFRTTRRLDGEHTLRTADAGKHYPDSVGCTGVWNIAGPVYEIPFGTLINKSVKNIFAAGRVISAASGHGWEIVRPIPACAVTGQAAGSAAAMFASNGNEVPIGELQAILRGSGVMLTMSGAMTNQSKTWLEEWRKQDDAWFTDSV